MADDEAEEYAADALDIVGGVAGTVASFFGGPAGAQAPMLATGAIKDIVARATGSAGRKAAADEAKAAASADEKRKLRDEQRQLEERKLALEERRLALLEQQAKNKIRDFDAPMYPAARNRPTVRPASRSFQPTAPADSDRIVDLVDLPSEQEAEPQALTTRGPLVDGAAPPGDSREAVPPERAPLVAYTADEKHFERAGWPLVAHTADEKHFERAGEPSSVDPASRPNRREV
jgi:hypothetical protein